MKLYTFMGNSPAEALQKAQNTCGKDALIVSTKLLKKKTISSPALHEVVVALEAREKEQEKKVAPITTKESVTVELSNQAQELSKRVKAKQPLSKMQTALSNDDLSTFKEDLDSLHKKLNSITDMIWDDKSKQRDHLVIPPEFASIFKIAKKSGMAKEHLDEIMKATLKEMPTYMKSSSTTVERYFQVLLKKMIGIRKESLFVDGSKKIMMFVGPTGVGKTTTLAKLAARYSFLKYDYKVGIITLDTYRIGAVEQLFSYAKMMKLPIEDVVDSYDFKKALERLDYCDIILIDTVGSSQFDKEKITKVASFLESVDRKIDVNLVVAASTQLEDLRDITTNFSFLELDTMIVTKFDESRGFGNIFSSALESDLPLSYFSVGQEVPDDLLTASNDFLVDCIFDGFVKKELTDAK